MRRALLLVLVTAALAGCSSAPVPEDKFYRLGDRPEEPLVFASHPFAGRLLIELPRAAGIRRQRGILYSEDPEHLELKRYHYHYWEDAPPDMLLRRLIARLREAALAPEITERQTAPADFRLRTQIRRFEREVDLGEAWAVLEIDFMVFDGKAAGDALFRGSYLTRQQAASLEMIDTAGAFSRAVDSIIDDFLLDVREANR